ncbi:hypothetical protein WA026_006438 [Henosepilachna vigintioctopunctata]|uniref:Uncharacterized protein n=1 Tax=Henosepilachna vigintioctopunctata TaxID=420089 RepID=A0AAW1TKG3_9CUCU
MKNVENSQRECTRTTQSQRISKERNKVKRNFGTDKRKSRRTERNGNIKEVYKKTKAPPNNKSRTMYKMTKIQHKHLTNGTNRGGYMVIEEAEQLKQYRQHFQEIPNQYSTSQNIESIPTIQKSTFQLFEIFVSIKVLCN